MQKTFSKTFEKSYGEAYGYDVSPYAVLDENLDAITDLLGNVVEEEF